MGTSLTAAAERLITYALNTLGAETADGSSVTLEDAFGSLHFPACGAGLRAPGGALITSACALRGQLRRAAGINQAGLTQGTLLTSLGPVTFRLALMRERRSGLEETNLRVSLRGDHPFVFGGVRYEGLSVSSFERPGYFACGNVGAFREGSYQHEVSPALTRALSALEKEATAALVTPLARHLALVQEVQGRLSNAAQAVQSALTLEARVQTELEALLTGAPPHPLPKGA